MTNRPALLLFLIICSSFGYGQITTSAIRESVRVDTLQSGALSSSLFGSDIPIGMWEAKESGGHALVDTTNTDLSNFSNRDAGTISTHATQVGTVLGGKGVSDTTQKGIATSANVYVYDQDYPYAAFWVEFGQAIEDHDLLVSNHSYAENPGWSSASFWNGVYEISSTEDYKFGYYGENSRKYDSIAELYPYHTIVKVPYNDRGSSYSPDSVSMWQYNGGSWSYIKILNPGTEADGGSDGYDGLTSDATSKNALVVGAVATIAGGYSSYSDISYTNSASEWGPTDDGRIKPDLVAPADVGNGTPNIRTSYAGPVVTGLVGLLQEYHQILHGRWMKSSTVRALLIHTADPATSNGGPSSSAGWGVVNASSAGKFLENSSGENRLIESSLANGETHEYSVYLSGSEDFRATLAWTDPKGASPSLEYNSSDLDDTTHILVNDLDVKLLFSGVVKGASWKLDASSPASLATRGNNCVDNVERIDTGSAYLSAGWYTIRVSHKGSLSSPQEYSLLLSNAGGVSFDGGTWSISPSSWNTGVLVDVVDTSNVAHIDANVTIGQLTAQPNTKVRIDQSFTLTTPSPVQLEADANGMALLKGNVSGNVRAHMYVSGVADYRYFGVPVKASVADWMEDMGRVNLNGSSSPSLYGWDASTASWVSLAETDSLHEHGGLVTYLGTNSYATFSRLPLSKFVLGDLLPRSASYTLTKDSDNDPSNSDQGWNLISNHTTAALDGNAIDFSGTSGSYYIWNPNTSQFAASDGTNHVNGGRRYIPRGQSFWVYCSSSSSGTLSIDTSHAVLTKNPDVYKRGEGVRVRLYSNGGFCDEVLIKWGTNVTRNFAFGEEMVSKFSPNQKSAHVHWELDGVQCAMVQFPIVTSDSCLLKWSTTSLDSVVVLGEPDDEMTLNWVSNGMDFAFSDANTAFNQSNGEIFLRWKSVGIGEVERLNSPSFFIVRGNHIQWTGDENVEASLFSLDGKCLYTSHWQAGETKRMSFTGLFILQSSEGSERIYLSE